MAAQYQDYVVKAGDTQRSVAKNVYGDENMYGFLQNNGITNLRPGETIKVPVLTQNPRDLNRDGVATSATPQQITQQTTQVPINIPQQQQNIGIPNAPTPPLSFGDQLARTPTPNPNISTPINVPIPQGSNGQRPQLQGGDQSFRILEGLKNGTISADQTPINPAEQEAFQMYQSYQKYGNADAKTLFDAIQKGELTPDPNNVLWRAISANGQATPAMSQAFAWWDEAQKRGATSLRGGKDPFLGGNFPDKVSSIDEANNLLNQDISGDTGNVWDTPSDDGALAAWEQTLNDAMNIKAPTAPNYTQLSSSLRSQYHVDTMEQDLNALDAQLAELDAQSRQREQFQMDQPVAMGVIAGRMTEVQRQQAEKRDYLIRQRDSIVNRVNTANNTIKMIMDTTQMDYQTAQQDYATKMNSAVQMMDQFTTMRKQDMDQFNKDRDYLQEERKQQETIARANLTTYYNAIMEGGLDASSLSKTDMLQISKMELQAGMPLGTFANLKNKNPTLEVKSTTEWYGSDGRKNFDVLMFDKATGKITKETIKGDIDAAKALDLQKTRQDIAMAPLDREYKQAQIEKAGVDLSKGKLDLEADYTVEGGGLSARPKITGQFGEQYAAGIEGTKSGKNIGTDFAVPVGTSVAVPPGNWKVVSTVTGITGGDTKNYKSGDKIYGNSVLLQNENGERIRLSHLSEVNVGDGDTVSGGTIVGKSGATGNVTGPHLDVEYRDPKGNLADVMNTAYGSYYASGGKVSKSSGSKQSATEEKRSILAEIDNKLNSVADSSGKVSIDNYAYLKNIWTKQGYTVAQFDDAFRHYLDSSSVKENIDIATKAVQDAAVSATSRLFK